MTEQMGLITKYILHKADGREVDPEGNYFVLKLNSKDIDHARASILATMAYAIAISKSNAILSSDLVSMCETLGKENPDLHLNNSCVTVESRCQGG